MNETELFVVPGERQVERLAREGQRAETRTSLRSRLAGALLPDMAFVDVRECRLVLGMALAEQGASAPAQMDLFGDGGPAAPSPQANEAHGDALLAAVRERGGASWMRLVAALDAAISLLRARGATADDLDLVTRSKGFLGSRARTLATAMRALDARLERACVHDARLLGVRLAAAIGAVPADELEGVVGGRRLRARWLLAWEASDVAWWRALDDKLAPRGGGARIVLPTFDRPLAAGRERDPLDALAEELAPVLDTSTESETIAPVLGDLTGAAVDDGSPQADPSRVRILGASDAVAQARGVAREVRLALAGGAAVERVAIAFPTLDERTLAPLRRALEEEGIVWHESRGALPSSAPVVAAALLALDAATSMDRRVVARLLRSGWVDPARLTGDDRRVAGRRLGRLARALETTPTVAGSDAEERLARTAMVRGSGPPRRSDESEEERERERDGDRAVVAQLVATLARTRAAATRFEHVRTARALWAELGIGARAGRGGLASFTSDAPPVGVPRAERLAIARDARAWDALVAALDLHETTARRVGALEQSLDAEGFRLELLELLDSFASQPGAGRAGAVRIARLADIAGDTLDLLVVVDANEGVLPRDDSYDALVSESLAAALSRATRGVFLAPAPSAARTRDLTALAVAAADAAAVVLTFAREDASNAPLAPSPVVAALERSGIRVLAEQGESPRRSGYDVKPRVAREREREGFFLDPARPRSEATGDLAPGDSAAQVLIDETGGGARSLAVTGLERFARCAFMGYAHVVLAAREDDHRDELPDAREEGTLVHEALAAAFLATREYWPSRPRAADEIIARGMVAADEILDRWQGYAALRAVVRLRVGDAVRAVLRAAVEDETWDFAFAEQSFGAKSGPSWTALELSEGDIRLSLRGSIDRVDRGHDDQRLRVVDYKRSKTTVTDAARSLGVTALQVPLYACVAARQLGLPATGEYVATQARDVVAEGNRSSRSTRANQRMDELVARSDGLLAGIERRALALVASVRSGTVSPMPARESECRLCAVSGGCRKPRFAMAPVDDAEEDGESGPSRDTL